MTLTQAKQLLSPKELEIYSESRNPKLRSHSKKDLSGLISRTRRLRNKYRDLSRRQVQKGSDTHMYPERTQEKAQLMAEVLERFAARKEAVPTPKAKKASPRRSPTQFPHLGAKGLSPTQRPQKTAQESTLAAPDARQARVSTKTSKAKRKARQIAKSGLDRVQAHVSSRTKRDQVRRDLRNA